MMRRLSLIALLLVVATGGAWGVTSVAQIEEILTHLRLIDAAKDELHEQDGMAIGQAPTEAEVGKYLKDGFPKCPVPGQYLIKPIGADPEVSLPLRAFIAIANDLRSERTAASTVSNENASAAKPRQEADLPSTSIPQAKPVIEQFEAVIQGNITKLRDSYSKPLQVRILQKHTWEEVLRVYRDAMTKELGTFNMSDFAYSYRESGRDHGSVAIYYKGKRLPGGEKRVVLENGEWKVNEK